MTTSPPGADSPSRRPEGGASKRVQVAALVALLAVALVAVLSFQLVGDAKDGSAAVERVQAAVESELADRRAIAEARGGVLAVDWSTAAMADGQMVRATIRTSVPSLGGQAVFMVDEVSGEVIPQDDRAARLLGPDAVARPHGSS